MSEQKIVTCDRCRRCIGDSQTRVRLELDVSKRSEVLFSGDLCSACAADCLKFCGIVWTPKIERLLRETEAHCKAGVGD